MTDRRQRKSRKVVKTRSLAPRKKPPHRRDTPERPNGDKLDSALSAYHEEVLTQNEQLREAHEELERSRDRYARLYEEAPVGLMTLDRNGVIEKANLTALTLLGANRDAVIRRPLLVFVHELDRSTFLNFLLFSRGNLALNRQWVEVRLRQPGGGFTQVQLSSVGVGRESGRGMVYLTALTDVSGRIQIENERREAEERVADAMRQRSTAQAANEAKDRFLAMLSHELRTPLTPALLRLSALMDDPNVGDEARDELKIILNNIRLEVRLIDDLLDLSRILRGKFEPDLQHIDLRDVIRQAIQICEPDIQAREFTVLPSLYMMPLPVHGDRVRLQQVFWNILRNAVKFTPEGGQISMEVTRIRGSVRVRIRDTGIGIERDVLPRIFDVFEQGAVGITRRFGGLGLGLAISKAILEAHGGAIEAASDGKDRGATITIALPLDSVPAPTQPPPSGDPKLASPQPESRKILRILLVEDHDETRDAMTRLLHKLGYDLESVPNAVQAASIAAQKTFDLVISDIGLPDHDGYELMRELRDQYNLRGIAVSGFGMEQDQARSREVGFQIHIVKPVTVEALQQAINTMFSPRQ